MDCDCVFLMSGENVMKYNGGVLGGLGLSDSMPKVNQVNFRTEVIKGIVWPKIKLAQFSL